MATEQEQIKIYIPRADAVEFKAIVRAEDKNMTAVLRRLIREYVAAAKAAA